MNKVSIGKNQHNKMLKIYKTGDEKMKEKNKLNNYRRHLIGEAGFNISWSAIIAGVVTFFACLAVLSLIGSAIGFGVVKPTSSDPFAGVGTGVLIWSVITTVLAFMAGGFIAGMAARRVGMLHGFLTWATSVLVLIVMLTTITTAAISGVGTLFGNAFSLVGDGVTSVASGVETVVEKGIDSATQSLGDVNTDEVQSQINEVLKDTKTPELQPDYLNNQLKEAGNEITQAGKELLVNPDNADQILSSLTESLNEKAETIGNAADRDAIAKSVSANTDLNEAEAKEATDNIYNGLQTASTQAQESINKASQSIDEAKAQIDQTIKDARVQADKAADATAKASIWAFIGLALALVLTTISGIWGSNFVGVRDEEIM